MSVVTKHETGTFCWVDLSTTNAAAAKRFYGELFGWSHEDVAAGEHGTYTMLRKGGRDAAALSEFAAAEPDLGALPHWLCYAAVDDADASARRVRELGGRVIAGPFEVASAGRMALVADPGGAAFALWQARGHAGAALAHEPGSMCWHELAARDEPACFAFYGNLFGWQAAPRGDGATRYTEWRREGRAVGGMMKMTPDWGDMPPHWMVYFAVEDVDAAARRADELGGTVCVPPAPLPGGGRFSILVDPQGALFSIVCVGRKPGRPAAPTRRGGLAGPAPACPRV
jgi:hypothetical protein